MTNSILEEARILVLTHAGIKHARAQSTIATTPLPKTQWQKVPSAMSNADIRSIAVYECRDGVRMMATSAPQLLL